MKNKYIGYIYCITNKINNKKYIGQTTQTIAQRFYHHKKDSKRIKTCLYLAFNKYGIENFSIKELIKIEDKAKDALRNKLNVLEQKYISDYNTFVPNGYNMTIGGDASGLVNSKEIVQVDRNGIVINEFESIMDATREANVKVSSGQLSDVLNGKNKTAKNYYWFFKDKVNIINNKIDILLNEKRVAKYSINGKLIDTYNSVKEASLKNNLDYDGICGCCHNYRTFCGGYHWKLYNYSKTPKNDICKYKDHRDKRVKQLDLCGNVIKLFNSIKEASNITGIRSNNICACCKGVYKTSGGYIWEYV